MAVNKNDDKAKNILPITYIHSDPSVTSLEDLVDGKLSLFNSYSKRGLSKSQWVDEIANYDGGTGVTNRQRMEQRYFNPDPNDEQEKYPLLKIGTKLLVPANDIVRSFVAFDSQGQVLDYDAFDNYVDTIQSELQKNLRYRPVLNVWSKYGGRLSVAQQSVTFSVWVYCKSVGAILDLTSYVKSLNTESGEEDSFQIDFAYVDAVDIYSHRMDNQPFYGVDFEQDASVFAKLFTENDIVWVRYEELELENENMADISNMSMSDAIRTVLSPRSVKTPFVGVHESNLAGKIYDFIGLVDNISQSVNMQQGVGSVSISGTSLKKLFMVDEAVFLPVSVIQNSLTGNLVIGDQSSGAIKRMFVGGEYKFYFASIMRNLVDTMKFYLNVVANVGLMPVRDMNGDTTNFFASYGDRRTKLYELKYADDKKSAKLDSNTLAKGLYQIVKLSVDPALEKRRLCDSSITNPSGSLLTLFQGICMMPFVQLILDVYKDLYCIVLRVPPFDKKRILKSLEGFTLEVTPDMVASENLTWETNYYTWFELQTKSSVLGMGDVMPLCHVPIVFLTEYVNVFGSKKMSVVSPYNVSHEKGDDTDKQQMISDMLFMIETHAYLPFTRRGTITLNWGDRRFKKGMWIRYKKTGEVFYVDSVSQSLNVGLEQTSRQTVLSVSRGLVEKYVKDPLINYFNVVDLRSIKKMLNDYVMNTVKTDTAKALSVDSTSFQFFCERRQFENFDQSNLSQ